MEIYKTKSIPESLILKSMPYILRHHVIESTSEANSGHPGGSLSAAEILTSLYFKIMRHNPEEPKWVNRDRFILSKAHAAPLLYSVLAESGYNPVEELSTLRKLDSRLQGHTEIGSPDGVEMTAGSLGQGLSFGIGTALAARLDGNDYRTHVLLGDGECDEGQVWEAAMSAAHFKIDNLVAIVDRNEIQLDGYTEKIMNLEPFKDKWKSFGWYAIEVDGHNTDQLINAFEEAKFIKNKPTVLIAHTIKGKGVSFMENNPEYHGKTLEVGSDSYNKALDEIEKELYKFGIIFPDRKNNPFFWKYDENLARS